MLHGVRGSVIDWFGCMTGCIRLQWMLGARKEDNVVVRGLVGTRMEFTMETARGQDADEVLVIFNRLAYSLCANHLGA